LFDSFLHHHYHHSLFFITSIIRPKQHSTCTSKTYSKNKSGERLTSSSAMAERPFSINVQRYSQNHKIAFLSHLMGASGAIHVSTLFRRLETSCEIRGTVLSWFKSYLHNRQQSVRCKSDSSTPSLVEFWVPQRSVLGPILFLLYTADIFLVRCRIGTCMHI